MMSQRVSAALLRKESDMPPAAAPCETLLCFLPALLSSRSSSTFDVFVFAASKSASVGASG